jgi:uncharacterized protein YdeI (YjbR/CyaY-like superfamily)
MKRISFASRNAFRQWLTENRSSKEAIWIEYYKDGSQSINYAESLEEALCFGWVDSLIKKVDERVYLRRFSPRRIDSKWSKVNQDLVKKLIAEGRMTVHGMKKVEAAKKKGAWKTVQKELSADKMNGIIGEFRGIIRTNAGMTGLFDKKSLRMQLLLARYYFDAKAEETRKKRIKRIHDFLRGKISIL